MRVVPLVRERLVRLNDAGELVAFLVETDAEVAARYDARELVPKNRDATETAAAVGATRDALEGLTDADFSADVLESRCRQAADEIGWKAGDFFRPLRLAVTGRSVSPPLFGSMELLGRDRVLARIDAALGKLAAAEVPSA
jgi:glutamyl-tRNA synthetase